MSAMSVPPAAISVVCPDTAMLPDAPPGIAIRPSKYIPAGAVLVTVRWAVAEPLTWVMNDVGAVTTAVAEM